MTKLFQSMGKVGFVELRPHPVGEQELGIG
jgi:hypothetical protein